MDQILLGLLLIRRLFNRYVTGMAAMVEELRLMLGSNRSFRITEEGPPELRELVRAINDLATQRDAYIDDVETQVAKAKANVTPFGGQLDPFKVIEQAPKRTYLPKRGIALPSATTTSQTVAPVRVLSLFEVAAELVRRGMSMNRERNEQIRSWHPDGVPENQMDALCSRLEARGNLRIVAAGGA